MIISPEVGPDFLHLFTRVVKMYNEELAVYCRSMAMMWPRLTSPASPAVLRVRSKYFYILFEIFLYFQVGSRGTCDSEISDVSSLELYGVYSVNVEPVNTINQLRQVLSKWTLLDGTPSLLDVICWFLSIPTTVNEYQKLVCKKQDTLWIGTEMLQYCYLIFCYFQ